MKKNKNPFKMWGSWIGAILGLLYGSFYYIQETGFLSWSDIPGEFREITGIELLFTFLGPVIIGFLIGWGLEVLFRKNKWFGLRS